MVYDGSYAGGVLTPETAGRGQTVKGVAERTTEAAVMPPAPLPLPALREHSKGLKIGIYSPPGRETCAGYEGSFGHEVQDATTFAAWGIDYLKYDLFSARNIYPSNEQTHRGLYQKMGEALQASGRPIVLSLCQYGENDPWKWRGMVDGSLWRTTGDIRDTWASMDKIGFSQIAISSYTRPGQWNDPDMLEIGNGGMNADEYRTPMSLWSMLAAPLIAGNDLRAMSNETKSILLNQEVIAVDQDTAAKPVQSFFTDGKIEALWRPMKDGSIIIGVFDGGMRAMEELLSLDERPTAVMCSNDLTAIGVLMAAHNAGCRVPEDCSVIGFDDIESNFIQPQLTTIRISRSEIATRAFTALYGAAHGGIVRGISYLIDTTLVMRQSTGECPTR